MMCRGTANRVDPAARRRPPRLIYRPMSNAARGRPAVAERPVTSPSTRMCTVDDHDHGNLFVGHPRLLQVGSTRPSAGPNLQVISPMAFSQSDLSEVLEALRTGDGVDIIRE